MEIFFSSRRSASIRTALLSVLLLLTSMFAGPSFGQNAPAKKYPSYPDVWGRELPVPEGVSNLLGVSSPLIDGQGRILIRSRWSRSRFRSPKPR